MSDKKTTSQTQKTDPTDHVVDQLADMLDRLTLVQANALEQARVSAEESLKIMSAPLEYTNKIATEWQKLGMAQARATAKLVSPLRSMGS